MRVGFLLFSADYGTGKGLLVDRLKKNCQALYMLQVMTLLLSVGQPITEDDIRPV